MKQEEEHLLDHESDVAHTSLISDHNSNRSPWLTAYFVTIHFLLLCCFAVAVSLATESLRNSLPYTIFPELQSLQYTVKFEHATNHTQYSAYSGPPNDVNAVAWEALIEPLELQHAGIRPETAVKVKDGGFIAALGVYHELHCLNKLRYFLYDRFSMPNVTQTALDYWTDHLDHCIEVLRISLMCTADLSLYTFSWPDDPDAIFLNAHSNSPRKCVKWEQLERWSTKRKISLSPVLLKTAPNKSNPKEDSI
ncbi:uncharacterized protein BDR25DRAFT_340146 [Lindgomyces ingoldianus]|uniref:Uncharacterized protein n=1 Tax=Lindgomyces ingoldianus TaxID=673940 RepID=A0ACB6R875_9PLEO|nr:uncharacterized protein BDR25DRAFT_340146 [Lindgomyces ingoldianus]KAF2475361.1 hypothetical protein BDR25DRAFT_340146 [Lindgomyces ingoldianus]